VLWVGRAVDLTHEDVKKILEIIDASEHLDEIELVYGGFRLHVRRAGAGAAVPIEAGPPLPAAPKLAVPAATLVPAQKLAVEPALAEGEVAIRAPMLGTFYRSPAPGEPPFVEIGKRVKAEDTVCLIEVMKLFSSIKAGVDGVVSRILVENGTMVEFNQMLLVIASSQ
jgi:acetyl-CoA carboxylase biotin carboxyl carrier protein